MLHTLSHHFCCFLGMGVVGIFVSHKKGFNLSHVVAQQYQPQVLGGGAPHFYTTPGFLNFAIPTGLALAGMIAGPIVECVIQGIEDMFGWITKNNQYVGENNMNQDNETFKGIKADLKGIKRDKQGVKQLKSSHIILDQDMDDNLIIAHEDGSYIFPRGGRQFIELGDGADNVVISLCTSKISSEGEVMVIEGLAGDDLVYIGCSKAAVFHNDFTFDFRAAEGLTYVYITGVRMGDTIASITDATSTLRGAFAVVGDHSETLHNNIITVEDINHIKTAEVAAMSCFPGVLLATISSDPEQLKNQICSTLIDQTCCEGRLTYQEIHPSGDVESHDHSSCHHH